MADLFQSRTGSVGLMAATSTLMIKQTRARNIERTRLQALSRASSKASSVRTEHLAWIVRVSLPVTLLSTLMDHPTSLSGSQLLSLRGRDVYICGCKRFDPGETNRRSILRMEDYWRQKLSILGLDSKECGYGDVEAFLKLHDTLEVWSVDADGNKQKPSFNRESFAATRFRRLHNDQELKKAMKPPLATARRHVLDEMKRTREEAPLSHQEEAEMQKLLESGEKSAFQPTTSKLLLSDDIPRMIVFLTNIRHQA